jgi:hypothetical protein
MKDNDNKLEKYIMGKNVRIFTRDSNETGIGRFGEGKVVLYVANAFIILDPPDDKHEKKEEEQQTSQSLPAGFMSKADVAQRLVIPTDDIKTITILD